MNFYEELSEEISQTREAETRGVLHPHREVEYHSRIHTLTDNLELVLFFTVVIGGFSFLALFVIITLLSGG